MTGAHWHLVLNHIPVVGIYFGLLILIIGFLKKNEFVKKLALWLLLLLALIALPAYFTGESAEEVAEHVPFTSESAIHEHEEAAEWALIGSIVIGLLVLLTFLMMIFKLQLSGPIMIIILLVTLVTAGMMAWTANLGGKIRRPELRGETISPSYEQYYDIEDNDNSVEPGEREETEPVDEP